ncbi:unnamed protein product [Boreogadus saida]
MTSCSPARLPPGVDARLWQRATLALLHLTTELDWMSASQNSCSTSRSPTRTIVHFPPPHPGLLARLHRQPDVGLACMPPRRTPGAPGRRWTPGVYQRTAGSTIESAANMQAPDAARPTNQGALTMEKLERGSPHRTTPPKGSGAGCR